MDENTIDEVQLDDKDPLDINLLWPMENDLPHHYVNQMSLSVSDNEAIIVFGSYLPTGFTQRSMKEIEEFARKATITPRAKIVMSIAGLESLYAMLKRRMDDEGLEEE